MPFVAQLSLHPGAVMPWMALGLIAGWLASLVLAGEGLGFITDLMLGLIGALIGGLVASYFFSGTAGFFASFALAFAGAWMFIAAVRLISLGRSSHS
jgi:uncharacterized membrane protein YeaQ/YmgE (transglycosylase-associated protein family)